MIADINECESAPCQGGGTCVDGVNGFTCDCTEDRTGTLCEYGEPRKKNYIPSATHRNQKLYFSAVIYRSVS